MQERLSIDDMKDEVVKILTETHNNNVNDWQTKSIRVLAMSYLTMIDAISSINFKFKVIMFLFVSIVILIISQLLAILYKL